jgi:signal transduction histidine kinase
VLPLVPTLTAMFAAAPAQVDVSGEPRATPTDVTQALVRAAQEALTNAQKYAPGAPLDVAVRFDDAAVSLAVHNGPPGPDDRPAAVGGSGMGLVGMRERIALVGGQVQAGPGPGGGWTVQVTVPTPVPTPAPTPTPTPTPTARPT